MQNTERKKNEGKEAEIQNLKEDDRVRTLALKQFTFKL